jgi:hypothetical protein
MGLTSDRSTIRVGGALVTVIGTTGIVSPTWTIEVDGAEVAREKIGDDAILDAPLPDGSVARVHIHQNPFGPTRVTVHHEDELVADFAGFLA